MNSTNEPNPISNIKVLISIFSVCCSIFLFTIGQGATNPILPLLVQNLGHTAAIAGFAVGIFGAGRAPGNVNTIDKITIASTANATDYGDLSANKTSGAELAIVLEEFLQEEKLLQFKML